MALSDEHGVLCVQMWPVAKGLSLVRTHFCAPRSAARSAHHCPSVPVATANPAAAAGACGGICAVTPWLLLVGLWHTTSPRACSEVLRAAQHGGCAGPTGTTLPLFASSRVSGRCPRYPRAMASQEVRRVWTGGMSVE